jgi:hypothetical protein
MASQREWESVVWHFLGDVLKSSSPELIKEWMWAYQPSTPAQETRWLKAIEQVQSQIERFMVEEDCSATDCDSYKLSIRKTQKSINV